MLGQLGLIILVLGAGIDVDLPTLELVGTRGFIVATVGSAFPISIGMFLAWLMGVGDTKTIIAAGAVFGPTSFGIAVNILKDGDVLKTYVTSTYIDCSLLAGVVTLLVMITVEMLIVVSYCTHHPILVPLHPCS